MGMLNSWMFIVSSCTAQNVSKPVSIANFDDESMMDFVEWYNESMKDASTAKIDNFKVPELSDIVAVVAYPADERTSIEITRSNGYRIGTIEPGYLYLNAVTFNKKGEVISGLRDETISSSKEMTVIIKRCPDCTFKQDYKGDL